MGALVMRNVLGAACGAAAFWLLRQDCTQTEGALTPYSAQKVAVASKSGLKLAATELAFNSLGVNPQVIGVKAASDINEQPFGHEETILGAQNRLKHTKAAQPDCDFYISIENGVFEVTVEE